MVKGCARMIADATRFIASLSSLSPFNRETLRHFPSYFDCQSITWPFGYVCASHSRGSCNTSLFALKCYDLPTPAPKSRVFCLVPEFNSSTNGLMLCLCVGAAMALVTCFANGFTCQHKLLLSLPVSSVMSQNYPGGSVTVVFNGTLRDCL
jgi:hypothetical protein